MKKVFMGLAVVCLVLGLIATIQDAMVRSCLSESCLLRSSVSLHGCGEENPRLRGQGSRLLTSWNSRSGSGRIIRGSQSL